MTHSAFNGWFPFRKGACQMISPFWDILFNRVGEVLLKNCFASEKTTIIWIYHPKIFFPRMHTVSGIWFLNRNKIYCHPCSSYSPNDNYLLFKIIIPKLACYQSDWEILVSKLQKEALVVVLWITDLDHQKFLYSKQETSCAISYYKKMIHELMNR